MTPSAKIVMVFCIICASIGGIFLGKAIEEPKTQEWKRAAEPVFEYFEERDPRRYERTPENLERLLKRGPDRGRFGFGYNPNPPKVALRITHEKI